MRGEYKSSKLLKTAIAELPPRARRIPLTLAHVILRHGTTSACAENTGRTKKNAGGERNYLRVRGEYSPTTSLAPKCVELPPRARRIPMDTEKRPVNSGTTSACAENTPPPNQHCCATRNYLRVRGEYIKNAPNTTVTWELPPRARRILGIYSTWRTLQGTTSACAENTLNELGLL